MQRGYRSSLQGCVGAEAGGETTGNNRTAVGGKNANNYSQYFLRCEEQGDKRWTAGKGAFKEDEKITERDCSAGSSSFSDDLRAAY